MAVSASSTEFDSPASDFRLKATDGKTYALDDIAGPNGTVIVFICNHCPYVKAVIARLVGDAKALMAEAGFRYVSVGRSSLGGNTLEVTVFLDGDGSFVPWVFDAFGIAAIC